ncbi:hypothetical protein NECAME_03951 [Necator americanus]|uniref:Uncharacterized protein n=1 Tax=Necator americanus TaxID=51031 RepID=W2SYK6_NECAM|nr:hypothetical protein NECAME_03951 [Necator americanus]ETN74638.1 hypothetical protein NECAME_03951 [Necator americanus]
MKSTQLVSINMGSSINAKILKILGKQRAVACCTMANTGVFRNLSLVEIYSPVSSTDPSPPFPIWPKKQKPRHGSLGFVES